MGSWEFLYLIQAGVLEIKVGVSKDVPARLAGLQTGNPKTLKIVRVWRHPKAREIESAMLKACCLSITAGEWIRHSVSDAVRMVETIIGSFEVVSTREVVRDKPETHHTGAFGARLSNLPRPRWSKDIDVFVTTAAGQEIFCSFVGKPGFGKNIASVSIAMRKRPYFWRILQNTERSGGNQ